jgi:HEAT repeat protein
VPALEPDQPSALRRLAAQTLGASGDPAALTPLQVAATTDDDADVRLAAARAVTEIATRFSAAAAAGALADPEIPRAEAVALLGRRLPIPGLQRALEDPDPLVQLAAAGLLAAVPYRAALDRLRALLEDPRTELGAAASLARLGDQTSIDRLVSR